MVDKECRKCGWYDPEYECTCPPNEPWLCRLDKEATAELDKMVEELRTCYCPICDKHFEVRSNDSMGNCPDCGHHVVLHGLEVAE